MRGTANLFGEYFTEHKKDEVSINHTGLLLMVISLHMDGIRGTDLAGQRTNSSGSKTGDANG